MDAGKRVEVDPWMPAAKSDTLRNLQTSPEDDDEQTSWRVLRSSVMRQGNRGQRRDTRAGVIAGLVAEQLSWYSAQSC